MWLQLLKKGSGITSVTFAEALDVAPCFGWIDGQPDAWDDKWFVQRFTPRTSRSKWSKINRDNVLRLIAEGRMRPRGLTEVERAQADGRWERAYDAPSTATVPDDLQAALDAVPQARLFFDGLNAANRYAVLHRIQDAKKPETRARRIEKYVGMLARGETIYP